MQINTIYNMDCMELINSGKLDKKVDLVVTDAPYEFINKNPIGWGFMNKENKKHLHNVNNSFGMSFEPTELLESCKRVCKKFNGYFFTNKSLLTKYIGFAEKNKYKFDVLLWLKNNPVPVFKGHYLIDKEYIVYIRESWVTFNSDLGYENYFTYQTFPIGTKEFPHPTVKPQHLLDRFIKVSSNEWDLVFDPYIWSWTTAAACKELGRNYIGCEINPEYCKMCDERLWKIQESEPKEAPLFNFLYNNI